MHFFSKAIGCEVSRRPKEAYYEITGEVEFSFQYRDEKLAVHVIEATGLAALDKSTSSSDPYVKLYLLPDHKTKKKTHVKRKNLDPKFDEKFVVSTISNMLWV